MYSVRRKIAFAIVLALLSGLVLTAPSAVLALDHAERVSEPRSVAPSWSPDVWLAPLLDWLGATLRSTSEAATTTCTTSECDPDSETTTDSGGIGPLGGDGGGGLPDPGTEGGGELDPIG